MAADTNLAQLFIEHLKAKIADREADLAPLEFGRMKLGHRGLDTGEQWVDITEAQAQKLRNEIANLQNVIERVRNDYA
jgi:hypothetical protein